MFFQQTRFQQRATGAKELYAHLSWMVTSPSPADNVEFSVPVHEITLFDYHVTLQIITKKIMLINMLVNIRGSHTFSIPASINGEVPRDSFPLGARVWRSSHSR